MVDTINISEIFCSRQGEGKWTGTESIFVRLAGCPLQCVYCDTAYAWNATSKTAAKMTVAEILDATHAMNASHVVITGGEPLANENLLPLIEKFHELNKVITLETSGAFFQKVAVELISISPKLSRAAAQISVDPKTVAQLMSLSPYQLKFVIDAPSDIDEALFFLEKIPLVPNRETVFFMPQAIDVITMQEKELWLKPLCEKHEVTYSPRMQIVWYGNTPMT